MTLDGIDTTALRHTLTYSEFEFALDESAYKIEIHLSLTQPNFDVLFDSF